MATRCGCAAGQDASDRHPVARPAPTARMRVAPALNALVDRAARARLHRRTEYRPSSAGLANRTRIDSAKLAAEMVERQLDVIVALSTTAARPAKQATSLIPIVAACMADPVEDGLVASLARPGGNVTGTTFLGPELVAKRLQLLREVVPQLVSRGCPVASACLQRSHERPAC